MNVKIEAVRLFLQALGGEMNLTLAQLLAEGQDESTVLTEKAVNEACSHYADWTPTPNWQEINTAKTVGKIPAIKEIRGRTNCGLKQAKDAIEAVVKEHEFYRRD